MLNSDILKKEILNSLDEKFKNRSLSELPECVELVEDFLTEKLKQNLIVLLRENIPTIQVSHDFHTLSIDGFQFTLLIGRRDLLKPQSLGIALLQLSPKLKKSNLIKKSISIYGCGRYSNVEIIINPNFSKYIDQIANLIQIALSTGYSWLIEFIKTKLSSIETNLSIELYSYLRKIFASIPKSGIVEKIWMAMIDKEKGFYILDRISAETTFSIVKDSKNETILSPAQLFSQFVTTVLPFEIMHARLAISEGKCIDIDLRSSKYIDSRAAFEIAEEIIFNSEMACMYPIVRENTQYLLASFPKDIKENVLPILEFHSQDMAMIFKKYKSKARNIWKNLREKAEGLPLAKTSGEFVGGILKSLLE